MKRVSADVGFIFIAYNLRRIINIIGIDELLETITRFCSLWDHSTSKNLHKALFCYLTSYKPTLFPKLKMPYATSFWATFTQIMKMAGGF
jgi:hypothetical protein